MQKKNIFAKSNFQAVFLLNYDSKVNFFNMQW